MSWSFISEGNSDMGGMGNTMGYSYGGWFMWLIVPVLLGVVIYFMLQKSKGSGSSLIETPSDTLKKRYAKGEINKEEFDRMKKDLES